MEQILYYIHYTLLLLFGIGISAAFSGIQATKGNLLRLLTLTAPSHCEIYYYCCT